MARRRWLLSTSTTIRSALPRLDSIARRLIEDWLHGDIEIAAS